MVLQNHMLDVSLNNSNFYRGSDLAQIMPHIGTSVVMSPASTNQKDCLMVPGQVLETVSQQSQMVGGIGGMFNNNFAFNGTQLLQDNPSNQHFYDQSYMYDDEEMNGFIGYSQVDRSSFNVAMQKQGVNAAMMQYNQRINDQSSLTQRSMQSNGMGTIYKKQNTGSERKGKAYEERDMNASLMQPSLVPIAERSGSDMVPMKQVPASTRSNTIGLRNNEFMKQKGSMPQGGNPKVNNLVVPPINIERCRSPYQQFGMQKGTAIGLNNNEQLMNQSGFTGNGFSSQNSPHNMSVMNMSRHPNDNFFNLERRSSIEQADINKMIRKNQGTSQKIVSPRNDHLPTYKS